MAAVNYCDLELAFDFVSSAGPMENMAYVSLDTGKIYWVSPWNDTEDEPPDDVETSDRYVAIPHKNDLDLGNRLVLRFVREKLPADYERVQDFFHRRGAYARFKDLLAARGRRRVARIRKPGDRQGDQRMVPGERHTDRR